MEVNNIYYDRMGTSTRADHKTDALLNPGPGNYNVSKGVGEGPKVIILYNIQVYN